MDAAAARGDGTGDALPGIEEEGKTEPAQAVTTKTSTCALICPLILLSTESTSSFALNSRNCVDGSGIREGQKNSKPFELFSYLQ